MTVEAYLEMCEIMGEEVDEAMMVGLEDFPAPVSIALDIYNYLPDLYVSGMEGSIYLGKDISTAPNLFEINGVIGSEDSRRCLWALKHINDRVRKKSFAKSKSAKPKGTPPRT